MSTQLTAPPVRLAMSANRKGTHASSPISALFFNDTATTEIDTLSLHDALPIPPSTISATTPNGLTQLRRLTIRSGSPRPRDRKSTRLNSSHQIISYAVFCLKKKKNKYSRTVLCKKEESET